MEKNRQWQPFKMNTCIKPSTIEENSETKFITEHYWGYSIVIPYKTTEYEVTHPKWKQYFVNRFEINVTLGIFYGNDFKFLNNIAPTSVILAEGSKITTENKKIISA